LRRNSAKNYVINPIILRVYTFTSDYLKSRKGGQLMYSIIGSIFLIALGFFIYCKRNEKRHSGKQIVNLMFNVTKKL
jgi:positive regulator of sigma E activity